MRPACRAAQLDWQVSPLEWKTIRAFTAHGAAVFRRGWVWRQLEPRPELAQEDGYRDVTFDDSHHRMGGTRMARSAAEGVVDTDLKLHGVDNAYVCSASVFPSSGFSNPDAYSDRAGDSSGRSFGGTTGRQRCLGRFSAVSQVEPMLEKIALPGSGRETTRLGFGGSGLMGGLSERESLLLLETAFDAGIRHFDVAPVVWARTGRAMSGNFFARKSAEVTVATKYGILPPARAACWMARAALCGRWFGGYPRFVNGLRRQPPG